MLDFFLAYITHNGFVYQHNQSSMRNYRRLEQHMHWDEPARKTHLRLFNRAVLIHANADLNRLETAQEIVERYDLVPDGEPLPNSVTKCKQLIKTLFVNIYDFVDGNATKFDTLRELRSYSKKNKMIYPKQDAKESEACRMLLRKLL